LELFNSIFKKAASSEAAFFMGRMKKEGKVFLIGECSKSREKGLG